MNILFLIAGFTFGFLFGIVVFIKIHTIGTLKIDHSNEDKDTFRFEIDDLDKARAIKRIVLYVDDNADLSR